MTAQTRSLATSLALAFGLALSLSHCGSNTGPSADPVDGGSVSACETAAQCVDGQRCEGGLCIDNKCTSSAECPSNFPVCNLLEGQCKEGTTTNPDGGPDGGPDAGPPVATDGGPPVIGHACTTKFDCGDGQICKAGKCANPTAANGCSADIDCPRGKICNFSKQCEAGCTSQKDCNDPQLCHPQKFVCEACSLTNACPKNAAGQAQQCVGGACKAAVACTSAGDCVAKGMDGAVCTAGFCGNCRAHGDCLVDPYKTETPARVCGLDGLCKKVDCSDAKCQTTLGSKGYCDTAANPPACSQYQCLADTDCTAPQKCNPADHTCTDQPNGCDVNMCNTQCQVPDPATGVPGTCNQATCACNGASNPTGGSCTTDADCGAGQACGLGICTATAVKPDGSACDSTTCALAIIGLPKCVSGTDPTHECDPTGCLMSLLMGGGGAAPCL